MIPAGAGNSRSGTTPSARPKNCVQIGSATEAAVWRPPSDAGVSNPTHTAAIRSGDPPMNQASVFSFVVPVFPARFGESPFAEAPVPVRRTSCINRIVR